MFMTMKIWETVGWKPDEAARLGIVWRSLKIKQKIGLFTNVVVVIILLSIFLAVWAIKSSLLDFSVILKNTLLSVILCNVWKLKPLCLETYIKTGDESIYSELERAMDATRKVEEQLPFTYEKIGEKRYVRTWSIRNMYQVYCEKRSLIPQTEEKTTEYIAVLYEVYDMQDYLQSYAKQLMRDTLEDGVSVYGKKVKTIVIVLMDDYFIGSVLFFSIRKMSGLMNSSIVALMMELAEASRKIAENDYFIEDVPMKNEDELGELVHTFNKMKYATGEYIMALEEKRRALDLYHAEELEKLEIAGRLDAMELALLKKSDQSSFSV